MHKLKQVISVLTLVLLFFTSTQLAAQDPLNQKEDLIFYENQRPFLDKWLEQRGIDQILQVENIEVSETTFVLYMTMSNYAHKDSAATVYQKVKNAYGELNSSSFEEDLFNYLTFLMEIPPDQTAIEIYDQMDPNKIQCFSKFVYFKNGKIATEEAKACRDPEVEVDIELEDIPSNNLSKSEDFSLAASEWSSKKVFKKIETFANEYFEDKGGELTVLKRGQYFVFEVFGMQKEVLPSSGFDWITGEKREWIKVTVFYEDLKDSFRLTFKVDGKFGSGIFKPRRSGYRPMEPDYTQELEHYTLKLSEKVRSYLLK